MKKADLITAVYRRLDAENKRKPYKIQQHKFYITDSDGNKAQFTIKRKEGSYAFTKEDVETMLDAFLDVTEDAIRSGDGIYIKGFGALVLHKRAARRTKHPGTDVWCDVEERLVPKCNYGNRLRFAARDAELIIKDQENAPKLPDPEYDFGEV